MKKQKTKICKQCGTENPPESKFCQSCGSKIKTGKKKKVLAVIIVILLVLGFAVKRISDKQQLQEAVNSYTAFVGLMMIQSKEITGTTAQVWRDAIERNDNPSTIKYTKHKIGSTTVHANFNTALSNLYSDPDFASKVALVKGYKEKLDDIYYVLLKKASKYPELENKINTTYELFGKIEKMVESPQGSLMTYQTETRQLYNDMETALHSLTNESRKLFK